MDNFTANSSGTHFLSDASLHNKSDCYCRSPPLLGRKSYQIDTSDCHRGITFSWHNMEIRILEVNFLIGT